MKKFVKTSLLFAALFSTPLVSCYKGNNSSSETDDKKEQTPSPSSETESTGVEYIDGGETKKVNEPILIDANTNQLNSGFYVVKGQVNVSSAIEIKGEVDNPACIILTDDATLSFGTEDNPLSASALIGAGSLCIYSQRGGTGKISIFTKDVKDVIKVGKYEQKGGNVEIKNSVTDGNVELGSAIFVNNNLLKVERGLLKLVGNYVDGLKASGILVTGGKIDITEANISGDAINSAATIKVERGAQIKVSNVAGNGIVATGNVRLSGKVEVNVEKTAVKSNGVVALQGNNIVAETSSSNLNTYHGVESTNGHIAIDFQLEDKEASLKATDFKVSEGNDVYVVNQKAIINSDDEVIQTGSVSDLTQINNKVLNPAYSVEFDSILNGSVSIKNNSATYFRPNTEIELNITPNPFHDLISESLVTNVQGTNVNVTQTGEGNNVTNKYSLIVPATNVVISAQFKSQYKGKGTKEDPFRIEDLKDWRLVFVGENSMMASSTYSGFNNNHYIRLDADLVITESDTAKVDNTAFMGNFDGNGHTITMDVQGDEQQYLSGTVSLDSYDNYALFTRCAFGFSIKNLILDGNMYLDYQYASPLVGVVGVSGDTRTHSLENIWVKTNMFLGNDKKYLSNLIGYAVSTSGNVTNIDLKNIRISSKITTGFDGDSSFAGLFGDLRCSSSSSQKYCNITIDGLVNEVDFNSPKANNYCTTDPWRQAYTKYTIQNTLFIPRNVSTGWRSEGGIYNITRNTQSNNSTTTLTKNNFYHGLAEKTTQNSGDIGYTIGNGNGVNNLVVLNDNGAISMPSSANPYTGLTITTNSLKYNNINYAKAGTTVKLLINNGVISNDEYEIVGGDRLEKGTVIINGNEVAYYTLTMPASDVVISKVAN